MRRSRIIAAAATFVLSALPLSELYAACTSYYTVFGEWRRCDNGTCWSESLWIDNQLVEGSVRTACYAKM
jgi:hypothetical protein